MRGRRFAPASAALAALTLLAVPQARLGGIYPGKDDPPRPAAGRRSDAG